MTSPSHPTGAESPTDGLVARLRAHSCDVTEYGYPIKPTVCSEAASLIESLQEQVREAKNLLNEWSGSGERELPRLYRETHTFLMEKTE